MAPPRWRPMTGADLAGVKALSDRIHPSLPERIEVFADRLAAFPAGSRVLADGAAILGYAVTHPAILFSPPPLDHLLVRVPEDADSYYLHDVAVAPELRGAGHARRGVEAVLAIAAAYPAAALISVYATAPFWAGFGFVDATPALPASKLGPYGAGARYMMRRRKTSDRLTRSAGTQGC